MLAAMVVRGPQTPLPHPNNTASTSQMRTWSAIGAVLFRYPGAAVSGVQSGPQIPRNRIRRTVLQLRGSGDPLAVRVGVARIPGPCSDRHIVILVGGQGVRSQGRVDCFWHHFRVLAVELSALIKGHHAGTLLAGSAEKHQMGGSRSRLWRRLGSAMPDSEGREFAWRMTGVTPGSVLFRKLGPGSDRERIGTGRVEAS